MNVPDATGAGAGNRIAFVVGEGTITRGDGAVSLSTGDGLESDGVRQDARPRRQRQQHQRRHRAHRFARRRGDASDDMWRAMNELHKKKPVVISMSDDAASGGYYMAMSGDPIVAYPGTDYRLHRRRFRQAQSARTLRQARHHQGLRQPRPLRADRIGLRVALRARASETARGYRFRLRGLSGQGRGGAQEARVRPSNRSPRAASGWAIRRRPTVWSTNSAASTAPSR